MSISNSFARGVGIEQSIRGSTEARKARKQHLALQEQANARAEQAHQASMQRNSLSLKALQDEIDHRATLRPHEIQEAERKGLRSQQQLEQGKIVNQSGSLALKKQEYDWKKQLETEDMAKRKEQARHLFPMVMDTLINSGYNFEAVNQKYPEYFELTKDMPNEMNFRYLMDDAQRQAIYKAVDIINPETPSSLTDDGAIDVFNAVFSDQINRGEGNNPDTGEPIVSKRIRQALTIPNQPGKLALELEIEDTKGNKYTAPRTESASTDANDKLKVIDANRAMGLLHAKQKVAQEFDKALQADPQAIKKLDQIYSRLNQAPSKDMPNGHMMYGNENIKFEDAFKIYQSYLPDSQMEPEQYRHAVKALPWDVFKWAVGDPQKMQYAKIALNRNRQVAQIEEQRLAELEPNDYQGIERVLQEMREFYFDPMAEYQRSMQSTKENAKEQKSNNAESQSDSVTLTQGSSEADITPLSLEDFSLLDRAKSSNAPPTSGRRPAHQYSYDTRTLDQKYQSHLKSIEEKKQAESARIEHQEHRRRQYRINQLAKQLEAGQLDGDGKQELETLLVQQTNNK